MKRVFAGRTIGKTRVYAPVVLAGVLTTPNPPHGGWIARIVNRSWIARLTNRTWITEVSKGCDG